jgi:hypothetical protein
MHTCILQAESATTVRNTMVQAMPMPIAAPVVSAGLESGVGVADITAAAAAFGAAVLIT